MTSYGNVESVQGQPKIILRTPGFSGVPGPPGPPSSFYFYSQVAPSSTWLINHGLGFQPSVQVFDSGSQKIEADVSHPSVNTVAIVFTVPTSGFARLN
jgi:hypothetical protein